MNLPWYRWYTGDWLGSPTRPDMSLAERGMYRDLLDGIGGRRGKLMCRKRMGGAA